MTKTTTKPSNSQLVKQIEYLLKEKTDSEDVLTNVDDLDNHPTLDFTEMIWYDKMI